MDEAQTPKKTEATRPGGAVGTCQICGKMGGVVYDPEKRPPNRLCYRCVSEYGMQDADDEE